jgi:uncharacterized membrane protein
MLVTNPMGIVLRNELISILDPDTFLLTIWKHYRLLHNLTDWSVLIFVFFFFNFSGIAKKRKAIKKKKQKARESKKARRKYKPS